MENKGLEGMVDSEKYTLGDGFRTGLCVGTDFLGTFYSAQTSKPTVGAHYLKDKPVGQEVMHSNYSEDYEFGKYMGMGAGVVGNLVFGFFPQLVSGLIDVGMNMPDKKK